MDLWITQAARVLRRSSRAERTSLDSLVDAEARIEHAASGLDPALGLALRLARALLQCGMPAHRVEEALARLALALDLDIDTFCTPTVMILTLAQRSGGPGANEVRTRVVRVEPGGNNLERLSALHDLVGRVERGELTAGDAAMRVEGILARTPRYGPSAIALGYALNSGAAAMLLGGGSIDVPIAAALGLMVGVLERAASRIPALARLLPALAACLVSFLASVLASQGVPVGTSVLLLAGIIVLLPGLTVTTAIVELANAHLVSGTARLMGGFVTFLQLGFGLALGRRLAQLFPEIEAAQSGDPWPRWVAFAAALASGVGFTLLLRARPRDGVWVLFSVTLAVIGSQLGGMWLGPELGAFVGALVVASASHAFARLRDRPVNLMLTPGTLFLVPGSIGFLSVRSLLENDVAGSVATGFRMLLVAIALAAGLLIATAAVPPKKAL